MKNFWSGDQLRQKSVAGSLHVVWMAKGRDFWEIEKPNALWYAGRIGRSFSCENSWLARYATKWFSLMAVFVHRNRISLDYAGVEINILLRVFNDPF